MREGEHVKTWVLSIGLAVCAVAGPAASAQDTHVKLYGGAGYVAPLSEGDTTFLAVERSVKAEKNVGWNAGIEGRFTKWLGLEVDYLKADQDVTFDGVVIGTTNFSPLTATLNVHVVHTTVVDFYLGPSYSYVNWGKIQFNAGGQALFTTEGLATDSERAWGAGLGLDVGVGEHFVFTGGLRYLNVDLNAQSIVSTPVNPIVGRLGIGVRF